MGDITSDLNYVVNKTTTPTQPLPGPQEALVISADPAAGVKVKIPSYHPDWAFGPAKFTWPGPGPLPPVNTACLVEFVGVDLTNPWIVAWATVSGGTPSIAGQPLAAPGATAATRYMGGTATGPPTSGAFAVGDIVVDQTGVLWVCITAGTPGTWRSSQDGPTGAIGPVLAPQPNQLLLHGQTVSRTIYARLFAWVQANNLLGAAAGQMFGVGDGSTTFVLPDWRGKVLRGVAATGETLGLQVGADSLVLALANLPAHKHSVAVAAHTQHNHNPIEHSAPHTHDFGTTAAGGNHGGHFPASQAFNVAQGGGGTVFGLAAWNDSATGNFAHSHNGTTGNDGVYSHTVPNDGPTTHTVTETSIGSGTAIDTRQASAAVEWAIWT